MADPVRTTPMSPAEYLAFEAKSAVKHEYVQGEAFAMSGATDAHNDVAGNVYFALRSHLRGRPCRAYMADVKLCVEAADAYYYPDVFVTCDPADAEDPRVKRSAVLVVEVLSDSTAAYDRGEKFEAYRQLETLTDYLIVDPRTQRAELFSRSEAGWRYQPAGPGEAVELSSVGLTLSLADIYDDTDVPEKRTVDPPGSERFME